MTDDIAADLAKLLNDTKAKLDAGEEVPIAWALAVPYVRRAYDEIDRLTAENQELRALLADLGHPWEATDG